MDRNIYRFDGEARFLSNFWIAPMWINQVHYQSVEHYFQACKTLDPAEHQRIAAAPTAVIAKRMGRDIKIREDWNNIRVDVMEEALRKKFIQHDDLRAKLLSTQGELVEGNWWCDTFWGVCGAGGYHCRKGVHQREGQNQLGLLLVKVRESMRTSIGAPAPTSTYDPLKARNFYDPDWCCGKQLTVEVQRSAAGYYIGTWCPTCGPYDRHSADYFGSRSEAEQAHMTGNYNPKF